MTDNRRGRVTAVSTIDTSLNMLIYYTNRRSRSMSSTSEAIDGILHGYPQLSWSCIIPIVVEGSNYNFVGT